MKNNLIRISLFILLSISFASQSDAQRRGVSRNISKGEDGGPPARRLCHGYDINTPPAIDCWWENGCWRCGDISFYQKTNPTQKIDPLNELRFGPNPFSSELNVFTNSSGVISIYSITGETMYRAKLPISTNVNTSSFQSGLYILEIRKDQTIRRKTILKID